MSIVFNTNEKVLVCTESSIIQYNLFASLLSHMVLEPL